MVHSGRICVSGLYLELINYTILLIILVKGETCCLIRLSLFNYSLGAASLLRIVVSTTRVQPCGTNLQLASRPTTRIAPRGRMIRISSATIASPARLVFLPTSRMIGRRLRSSTSYSSYSSLLSTLLDVVPSGTTGRTIRITGKDTLESLVATCFLFLRVLDVFLCTSWVLDFLLEFACIYMDLGHSSCVEPIICS